MATTSKEGYAGAAGCRHSESMARVAATPIVAGANGASWNPKGNATAAAIAHPPAAHGNPLISMARHPAPGPPSPGRGGPGARRNSNARPARATRLRPPATPAASAARRGREDRASTHAPSTRTTAAMAGASAPATGAMYGLRVTIASKARREHGVGASRSEKSAARARATRPGRAGHAGAPCRAPAAGRITLMPASVHMTAAQSQVVLRLNAASSAGRAMVRAQYRPSKKVEATAIRVEGASNGCASRPSAHIVTTSASRWHDHGAVTPGVSVPGRGPGSCVLSLAANRTFSPPPSFPLLTPCRPSMVCPGR